jgi:hypothetical protein
LDWDCSLIIGLLGCYDIKIFGGLFFVLVFLGDLLEVFGGFLVGGVSPRILVWFLERIPFGLLA